MQWFILLFFLRGFSLTGDEAAIEKMARDQAEAGVEALAGKDSFCTNYITVFRVGVFDS